MRFSQRPCRLSYPCAIPCFLPPLFLFREALFPVRPTPLAPLPLIFPTFTPPTNISFRSLHSSGLFFTALALIEIHGVTPQRAPTCILTRGLNHSRKHGCIIHSIFLKLQREKGTSEREGNLYIRNEVVFLFVESLFSTSSPFLPFFFFLSPALHGCYGCERIRIVSRLRGTAKAKQIRRSGTKKRAVPSSLFLFLFPLERMFRERCSAL